MKFSKILLLFLYMAYRKVTQIPERALLQDPGGGFPPQILRSSVPGRPP
jgi:hypothetical protein